MRVRESPLKLRLRWLVFEELRASDETCEAYRWLGDRVREALGLAGIQNHLVEGSSRPPGAGIILDFGADESGGVFIIWRPSETLIDVVVAGSRKGPTDDPAFDLSVTIRRFMREAMIGILQASGFEVTAVDSDMMPPAIRVHDLGRTHPKISPT
jgi:hypothetical protein